MHGSSGRFAKVIFYVLQANPSNTCTAVITGKSVNLGKGKGMQVPCTSSQTVCTVEVGFYELARDQQKKFIKSEVHKIRNSLFMNSL